MTFRPNPHAAEEIAADPDAIKIREAFAAEALTEAQRLTDDFTVTGDFRNSLQVEGTTFFSDDPGAAAIEVGTDDTAPKAVMRRAVEAVGARYVDTPDA